VELGDGEAAVGAEGDERAPTGNGLAELQAERTRRVAIQATSERIAD